MDPVDWLQEWYIAQCDGTWEHTYGVTIETLDNPGWLVTIELTDTALAGTAMTPVGDEAAIGREGWLHCRVESDRFRGAGGPSSLKAICAIFRAWAEQAR